MKNKIKLLLLLYLFPFSIYSQNNYRSEGTFSFGGDLGFSTQSVKNSNASSVTVLNSNLYVGYMAAPGFEIGFRPGFSISSSGDNSYKTYNLFLNPAYNFNSGSNIIPYLGLLAGYNSIGYEDGNDDDTYGGAGVGGEAGIKINLQGTSLLLIKFE